MPICIISRYHINNSNTLLVYLHIAFQYTAVYKMYFQVMFVSYINNCYVARQQTNSIQYLCDCNYIIITEHHVKLARYHKSSGAKHRQKRTLTTPFIIMERMRGYDVNFPAITSS